RIILMNGFFHALFLFRTQQSARHAASHRIQQFQPIFQRRMFHRLPSLIAARSGKEAPAATDTTGIDLGLLAGRGALDPADFGFAHVVEFRVTSFRLRVSGWRRATGCPQPALSPETRNPKPETIQAGSSTLATAIAATPSSRPTKPKCSLVVALMPTLLILICNASAM